MGEINQVVVSMDSVSTIENSQEVSVSVGNVLVVAGKKGDTGDSGVGVDDIFVNGANNLIFKLTDGRQLSAGYLPAGAVGPQGVQGLPGRDGRDGGDGRGIANITLIDGQLNISMSDGTVVPLGTVKGANGVNGTDGTSVVGAFIQPNGNLHLFLSDGNFIDCGSVVGSGSGFVAGQISQFVRAQEFPWLACDGSLFEMAWYPHLAGCEYLEKVPAGSLWYANFMGSNTAGENNWKAQLNTLAIDAGESINLLSPRSLTINVVTGDLSSFSQRDFVPFSDVQAMPCVAGDPNSGESISGYATSGTKHMFMSELFGTSGNRTVEIAVSNDLVSFNRTVLATINDDNVAAALLHYDADTQLFYALVGASVHSSADGLSWSLVTASAAWGPYSGYRPSRIIRVGNKIAVLAGANIHILDGFAASDLEAAQARYIGFVSVDRAFAIDGQLYLTDLVKAARFDLEHLVSYPLALPQAFTSARQVGQSVLLANDAGDVFKTSNFTSFDAVDLQTHQDYSANLKTIQFHPRSNGTLLVTHGSNNRDIKLLSVAFNETEKWKLPNIPAASGAKSYIKVQ